MEKGAYLQLNRSKKNKKKKKKRKKKKKVMDFASTA